MDRSQHRSIVELFGETSGSLLPMAAAGLVVLAGIVGGGLDASRAYKAQTRLQSACDAGVLAGRKAVGTAGFDTQAKDEADAYFANNFSSGQQGANGTAFVPTSPDNGNTVQATASADVSTTVMRIFGFESIPISVTCSASMGVGNSDVTMVLDTTGSMGDRLTSGGDTKIEMLRDAMKNFYTTVQGSVAGGNARIRYSFVPYSQSINVGRLIYDLSPSYLVDSRTIQSREAVPTQTTQTFDHWSDPVITNETGTSTETVTDDGDLNNNNYSSRNACTNSLPSNTTWTNSGGTTTDTDVTINSKGQRVTTIATQQKQVRTAYTCVERTTKGRNKQTYYVPYFTKYSRYSYNYRIETQDPVYVTVTKKEFVYRARTYDVSAYKAFSPVVTQTGQSGSTVGTDVTSTWAGCIEERATTPAVSFNFNRNTNRITPVSAIDLDIDRAPDSGNDTKWAPMWPEVAYYRTAFISTGRNSGYYDLTNSSSSLTGGQAPSSCPQKARLLGAMSKSDFDAYADSLYPAGNTYHDLGILWGARLSSPDGMWSDLVNAQPTNGGNVSRHMIFMTDGQMQPSIAIQSTYGIEYHDRRITANGTNLQDRRHTSRFLALCEAVKAKGIRLWVIAFSTGLSDDLEECASDNSAFTADDANELNEAFQEIAKEVGELRIVQ